MLESLGLRERGGRELGARSSTREPTRWRVNTFHAGSRAAARASPFVEVPHSCVVMLVRRWVQRAAVPSKGRGLPACGSVPPRRPLSLARRAAAPPPPSKGAAPPHSRNTSSLIIPLASAEGASEPPARRSRPREAAAGQKRRRSEPAAAGGDADAADPAGPDAMTQDGEDDGGALPAGAAADGTFSTPAPWSDEHERVAASAAPAILVTGVAGCGKTELLVRTALRAALGRGAAVLIASLVSSVRDEVSARMNAALPRPIRLIGASHRARDFTPDLLARARKPRYAASAAALAAAGVDLSTAVAGGSIQVSTIDAVIHQTLDQVDRAWLRRNLDRHDSKVSHLAVIAEAAHAAAAERVSSSSSAAASADDADADVRRAARRFTGPVLNTGRAADLFMLDEYQDVDAVRAKLLATMAAVGAHRSAAAASVAAATAAAPAPAPVVPFQALVVGDPLQSVFEHALELGAAGHPFASWAAATSPALYHLSTCFRCPPSHVAVANLLMRRFQEAQGLGAIIAARPPAPSGPAGGRPFLFTHEAVSNNAGATDTARRVVAVIAAHMDLDPSLAPGDVVVVMAKVNSNAVMGALENELEDEYLRRGFGGGPAPPAVAPAAAPPGPDLFDALGLPLLVPLVGAPAPAAAGAAGTADAAAPARAGMSSGAKGKSRPSKRSPRRCVHYFATEGEAGRIVIRWGLATGKTALSSIHAVKGRSARLVVLVGVTEGSLPREVNVHGVSELVDHSVLNVGLTRSTQYLAVGMHARRPSRYLAAHRDALAAAAVLAWDPSTAADRRAGEGCGAGPARRAGVGGGGDLPHPPVRPAGAPGVPRPPARRPEPAPRRRGPGV
jgi:hypothetical protein